MLIKYHKKKRPDVFRSVVRSLERGLQISMSTFESLGDFEKISQTEVDVRSLQLLVATMATEHLKTDKHTHSPSEIEHADANLVYIRSALNSEGITVGAICLLASDDEHVVQGALKLLVNLLEDGHRECQNSIYEYFIQTSEEKFFVIVRRHLLNSRVAIKEARVLTQMKLAKQAKERELAAGTLQMRSVHHQSVHKPEGSEGMELAPVTTITQAIEEEEPDEPEELLTFSKVVGFARLIFRMLQVRILVFFSFLIYLLISMVSFILLAYV